MIHIPKDRSKYGNDKITLDGITFDSALEGRRYSELKLLQKAGEISNLQVHPVFRLLDHFRDPWTGDCQKAINYIGDFLYTADGHTVCEDTKGFQTKDFLIKWKWAKHLNRNIEFKMVSKVRK